MQASTIETKADASASDNDNEAIGWAAFSAVAVAAVLIGSLFGGAHVGALMLLALAFVWSAHHFVAASRP